MNSISTVGVSLAGNFISLFTLPLYLSIYGDSLWGIFIWASSASGLLAKFDLGVKSGLRRYTARFSSNGDISQMNLAISITAIIMCIVAILNALLILFFSIYPSTVLSLNKESWDTARSVLVIASGYTLVFWSTKYFEAIIEGFQLHFIKNLNLSIASIANIILYIVALSYRFEFITLVGLLFLVQSIPLILHVLQIVRRGLLKKCSIKLLVSKQEFINSEFSKYSGDIFILGIIQVLAYQMDKVIIGAVTGAAFITYYVIVTKPMFIIQSVDSYIYSALQPMIAKEQAAKNTEFLKLFIPKSGLYHFLISVPLCLLIIFLLRPFIHIWIGHDYDEYLIWGQIAAASLLFTSFYTPVTKYLVNTGHTHDLKRIYLITNGTNAIVSVILTFFLGIGGVIIGSLVDQILRVIFYTHLSHTKLGINLFRSNSQVLINSFIYLLVVVVFIFFVSNRVLIDNWMKLFSSAVVGGLLFYGYSIYVLHRSENIFRRVIEKR
jgi:O-antigen/teichoic acid export membrane protein